jgi:hypothetical protein
MPIVDCGHHGSVQGKKRSYVQSVKPVGYPNDAVLCNKANCQRPGLVWLDEEEWKDYQNGLRIFGPGTTGVIKIGVA